jgi:hypothetical protein
MSERFEEADLSRIRATAIASRDSKVHVGDIVDPRTTPASVSAAELARAFPRILAADSLLRTVDALRRARADNREIVWLMGAHVIKCGLGGYLNALIDGGFVTCLATTGSSTIHDLELAFFGHTSEDVAAELPRGRFGMSAETSQRFNAAIRFAAEHEMGLGQGIGAYIAAESAPHRRTSVFAGAHAKGVPATVHVALGTDITHPHPGFPAAEAAELSMRDFRILAHRVGRGFDAGVVILAGSAVVLPEVFLKAVSVAYNLGAKPGGVFTACFDMLPQYRVRENVLSRPFRGAGESHMITGHHEILLPLLYLLLQDGR